MKSPLSTTRIHLQSAMTFMELIVVISIFGIMATIVLSNFKSFTNQITIQNIAHDVALRIIEAQRSAVSGKLGQLGSVPNDYVPTYGIFADTQTNKITLFVDAPSATDAIGNLRYDDAMTPSPVCPGIECISELTFANGYALTSINRYRYIFSSTPVSLLAGAVIYRRPSFAPIDMYGYTNTSYTQKEGVDYDEMDLLITAPTGESAMIKILGSGQVIVQ